MAQLHLDYARCVLTTNRQAECRACADICPTDAIRLDETGLAYAPGLCIGCTGCLGACPTEAFRLGEFSTEAFVSGFVQSETNRISCKGDAIPCLAALAPEYLIGMALEKGGDIVLDTAVCESCDIAEKLLPQITSAMGTANYFLEQTGLDFRIVSGNFEEEERPKKELSRRELFNRVNLKDGLRAKRAFDAKVGEGDDTYTTLADADLKGGQLRHKHLPFRRSFFINAIRDLPEDCLDFEASKLPFISAKRIDKNDCTNCARCYHVCPTGALHGEQMKGVIFFDFLHCVACGSCEAACEPVCLHREENLAAAHFKEPARERLATFFMRQCGDCGMPYINDGEPFCPRCREMDDEARELVGF